MRLQQPECVSVADGKYTVRIHADGNLDALRNGETWQDLTGNKLVYWLAVELQDARAKTATMLEALNVCAGTLGVFVDDGSASPDSVVGKTLTIAREAITGRADDRGITDSRCDYIGPTRGICNKCGRQHDGVLRGYFAKSTKRTTP